MRDLFNNNFKVNLTKNVYVYDVETDGLLDSATKIHCLSICWIDQNGKMQVKSTSNYDEMRKFFLRKDITRIGHNITLYDERVVAKLLNIDTLISKGQIVDTLALSWCLFTDRIRHGLEDWGIDLGTRKVEIKDWKNLSTEEYIKRCETDTIINMKLWNMCKHRLMELYDNDEKEVLRFIDYLQFKLDCIREQEDEKLKIDIEYVNNSLNELRKEKQEKEDILKSIMPKVPIVTKKTFKNVIVLEDGSIYSKGDLLYDHYYDQGYKPKFEYIRETIKGYKEPNPNSTDQKKNWLYSLGWKPQHFKHVKEENGSTRKIPQISSQQNVGSICDSIKELFVKEPKLEVLEGLSVLGHRIALLEGFLENQKDGYIEASMAGLTNTLRLKHSNIVNLPGVKKAYGKMIRGALIAEDDGILCGSDMSSLEDSTKQHYMYFHDPKYVSEMRVPGFDPHLDIAVLSGLMTKQDAEDHKKGIKDFGAIRSKAKTVNFASVYGAGPPKIALTANISLKEAKLLHKIYWERNKSVKQVADNCEVKLIGAKKWLRNPISGFWYSLRADKDKFSTLNQGTGVYCFDKYIRHVRNQGIKISLQMHDEILFKTTESNKEVIKWKLKDAIAQVNNELKLNIPLGISMDFGKSYADCH